MAQTVCEKWQAGEFTELDTYIGNLYTAWPNYVPAILAGSFRDWAYLGHLSDAQQKLGGVRQLVDQNPEDYGDGFNFQLHLLEWGVQTEIDIYTRRGISESQLQPDPAAVRDAHGSELPTGISILFYYADETSAALIGTIKVNEALANSTNDSDWIELYNATGEAVDIGGWFLSDSQENDASRKKYEIAAGTVIQANGYRVFTQNEHFGNSADAGCHTPFALSEDGGTVYLCAGSEGAIVVAVHQQTFGPSESGVSFGTYQKGDGSRVFVAMSANTAGAVNAAPKVGPIVIDEILYHPSGNADAEYIELVNVSGFTVTLYDSTESEAWRLVDDASSSGISYSFPTTPPVTLAAGEHLLLVKNLAAFNAEGYGDIPSGVTVLEWGTGSLGDDGGRLQLLKQRSVLVDRVTYDNTAPWPTTPDGTGQSLRRITASNYGDDCANWEAATATPGE